MTYDDQCAQRAADREAQLAKSQPYVPGRFVPGSFSVGQRGTHHFDVYAERRSGYVQWYYREENPNGVAYPMADGGRERAFAIRGEPGDIFIRDERWDQERPRPRATIEGFTSVAGAMAWIAAELVHPDEPKAPPPPGPAPVRDAKHALELLDDVDSLVRFCSVSMLDVQRYNKGSKAFWRVVHWIAALPEKVGGEA